MQSHQRPNHSEAHFAGLQELAGNQELIPIADDIPTLPPCNCPVTPFLAIEYARVPSRLLYVF